MIVLQKGRVVLSGSIAELTGAVGQRRTVEVEGDLAAFRAALRTAGFVHDAEAPTTLWVEFQAGAEDVDALFSIAAATGARITRVAERKSSLEQVFLAGLGGPNA